MIARIIVILLILLNLFVALNKKRSKPLLVVTSFFIILFFVGSRGVLDLPVYNDFYRYGFEHFGNGGQFLFQGFTLWCSRIGMPFDIYRLIISVVGISLYCVFIERHSPLPNLVMAFYMCYLMFMDDVQIKNFIACAAFGMGLSHLLKHDKNWKIQYVIWIIVAGTLHSSFWVYFLLLLIPKDEKKDKLMILIGLAALAFSIFVLFFRDHLNEIALIFSFIDEEKTEKYAVESNNFGSALFIIIQFFAVSCLFILKKYLVKNKVIKYHGYSISQSLQLIFIVDVLSLMLVPAAIFSITFYRLVRNLFMLNAVAFSFGYYYAKNSRRLLPLLMLACYTWLYYFYDLTMEGNIEGILNPFFNNNIFFSL